MDQEQRTARKLIKRDKKNDKTGQPLTDELTPREIKEREQTVADVEATKAAIAERENPPEPEMLTIDVHNLPEDTPATVEEFLEDMDFDTPKTPEQILEFERKVMFGDIERRFAKHAAIAEARGHRSIANDLRHVATIAKFAKKRAFSAEYWK